MSNVTLNAARQTQSFRSLTGLLALGAVLVGCAGALGGPRSAVTYELRAVNGTALPVAVGAIGDDTLRILGERITLRSDDHAEALRRQQLGTRPPTVETTSFFVRSAGDSVRLVFPCPANAVCSVPSRVGLRAVGTSFQLQEEWLNGLTFTYVRVE